MCEKLHSQYIALAHFIPNVNCSIWLANNVGNLRTACFLPFVDAWLQFIVCYSSAREMLKINTTCACSRQLDKRSLSETECHFEIKQCAQHSVFHCGE